MSHGRAEYQYDGGAKTCSLQSSRSAGESELEFSFTGRLSVQIWDSYV